MFSNFDTLMYSALNHLSIKAIKHRFSAAHLNCAVFVADDRCSSMMIKPDAQAHAQAMRSTRQGCPSPAQRWPRASELSCLAETAAGAQGHVALTCFPFVVFDPIIGTV